MHDREETPPGIVEGITPWFFVALAVLAGLGAVIRIGFAKDARLLERLDRTTLLYLGVAGGLLLLRQVKSLSFGGYKLEMIERVREKQARQEDQIEDIALMLPLLLPANERIHLVNLDENRTGGYKGNHALRAELRRLRSLGLIRMLPDQHIGYMRDNLSFDLAAYAELSDLGKRWVKRIQKIEMAEAGPDEKTVEGQ
jgi:hypothetical protein